MENKLYKIAIVTLLVAMITLGVAILAMIPDWIELIAEVASAP